MRIWVVRIMSDEETGEGTDVYATSDENDAREYGGDGDRRAILLTHFEYEDFEKFLVYTGKLRRALQPFADESKNYAAFVPGSSLVNVEADDIHPIRVEDLRAAAEALKDTEGLEVTR